jgi:hypothetical protein
MIGGGIGEGEIGAELYDPATGRSTITAAFTEQVSGHTATLLLTGEVLVAGGDNPWGSSDSAYLYDPTTDSSKTWLTRELRCRPTATLLADGRVLVAGGRELASAQLYDPATGEFSVAGSMGARRTEHSATLLTNGAVLLAGGRWDVDSTPGSAELFP